MKVTKQEAIKLGITLAMIVTAVTLTMVFARGTVDISSHEATLHARYDYKDDGNITHVYTTEVNFTFLITNSSSYPEIIETYDLGDNFTLWLAYSPVIEIGYNKQLNFRVSITDETNTTVSQTPVIGIFSRDIRCTETDENIEGLDLTLPASSI